METKNHLLDEQESLVQILINFDNVIAVYIEKQQAIPRFIIELRKETRKRLVEINDLLK
ncbi:MAG TPA: hypothetical protein PKI46_03990 [Bacteroidales bacterium]|nr:hypothetical protein [Bacteroidales bacterium]